MSHWDANLYQQAHSFVWKYGEDLFAMLDPRRGERILDAGCGTGQLTAKIAASGAEVTGLDRSADMVAMARLAVPGAQFVVSDITAFESEPVFDAVFSNAVLHWVKPPEEAARRLAGALKPGGRFVAEFGGYGNVQVLMDGVFRAGERLGVKLTSPWYFPAIGQYATILDAAGFEVRQAFLIDRPTVLDHPQSGMRDWIAMFGQPWLTAMPEAMHIAFLEACDEELRPALFHDGRWHADYRRIRVAAIRG